MAVLIATLFTAQPSAISSNYKVGFKCSKINEIQKSPWGILTCDLNKGKKVWRKASAAEKYSYQKQLDKAAADAKAAAHKVASKACWGEGICKVGDIGPGGGTVFYDAGSLQPWGRYLEFAPDGWSGGKWDPREKWCDNTDTWLYPAIQSGTVYSRTREVEIGRGMAATNLMLAKCKSGAAVVARGYLGGGKSDWFLPTEGDLRELCKYATFQPSEYQGSDCIYSRPMREGFRNSLDWPHRFWSSSQQSATLASAPSFISGDTLNIVPKHFANYVRPVRAF